MIGKIETANKSKSGKTLGLKINGTWYMTKEWGLESMVGQNIEFTPSISSFEGKEQRWINNGEYTVGDKPLAAPAPLTAPATDNTVLLGFVGQCLSNVELDRWDTAARASYKIGKDILNGRYDAVTTAGRMQTENPPPEYADRNQEDEFGDDIPF